MQPHRSLSVLAINTVFAVVSTAFAAAPAAHAQQTPPSKSQPVAGGNWARVQALPAKTKVHITTDHGGHTCRVFAVSDDALTCAKGISSDKAGTAYQRAEIQHIKLAHYVRSTLAGAGLGAGIGAIAGGIAGRNPPCPPNGFCLNILGPGAVAAIFGVGAAVVGAGVGGPTDFTRGSSIYVRP